MKRQIDIDLLLPKIIKLKTRQNDDNEKTFSANQILWILEQEFALQNSMVDDAVLSSHGDNESQCVEIVSGIFQHNIKICNCQSELFEIKTAK